MHLNLQILCQQGVMFYKVTKLLHLYSKVLQSISSFILAKKGCAHVSQTKLAWKGILPSCMKSWYKEMHINRSLETRFCEDNSGWSYHGLYVLLRYSILLNIYYIFFLKICIYIDVDELLSIIFGKYFTLELRIFWTAYWISELHSISIPCHQNIERIKYRWVFYA